MATIYKITNKINGLCYIGKTVRPVSDRWHEHLRDFKEYIQQQQTTIPLYNAFNTYGIDNFNFQIVETNIPNNEINNKERYYIQFFHSKIKDNGYNVTDGGDGGRVWSKLTEQNVLNIIKELQDINSLKSLSQIANEYNISARTIIAINHGECWFQDNLDYPIRKYDTTGLTISKIEYKNIIDDIQNSNLKLQDIQKKYSLSENQISAINNGKNCYNGTHPYYKDIYNGPFPVRKNNNSSKIINKEFFVPVFYDVLFTNDSMATIGAKYGINGPTLQGIITGKRRKELTTNYILPMRKNITLNQENFLKLYPQFNKKGGG